MAMKRTTVMVDEDDLALVKAAARREGRPEAELIREAFHLIALRSRRWDQEWDIPTFEFPRPISAEDTHQIVADEVNANHR